MFSIEYVNGVTKQYLCPERLFSFYSALNRFAVIATLSFEERLSTTFALLLRQSHPLLLFESFCWQVSLPLTSKQWISDIRFSLESPLNHVPLKWCLAQWLEHMFTVLQVTDLVSRSIPFLDALFICKVRRGKELVTQPQHSMACDGAPLLLQDAHGTHIDFDFFIETSHWSYLKSKNCFCIW